MRTAVWIGMTFVLFVSGGATCFRRDVTVPFPPPPIVFSSTPTLEQLTKVLGEKLPALGVEAFDRILIDHVK